MRAYPSSIPRRSRRNKCQTSLTSVDDFNNPFALASTFLLNLSALEVDPFCILGPVWPYPAWVFVATVTACITQVFLAYR
jgi:hypothetical protein